jgi:hypothetical protein
VVAFQDAPDPLFPLQQMSDADFGCENLGHGCSEQKRGIL